MSNPDPSMPEPIAAEIPADRPHRPADDTEEVYFQGSPLLRGEIGKMLLTFLIGIVLVALPIVAYAAEWNLPALVSLAIAAVGVLVIIVPVLLMKTVRYRVSNYRIDYEHGLFSKNIDTLELWHVEDIEFHQSLFDRIFGVGTITIISHDETTPTLALKGVPNVRPLFETLKQRVIAVKRQRGVIKMDVG